MTKKTKRPRPEQKMQEWFKTNKEVVLHIEWMQSTINAYWREMSDRLTMIEARLQILEDEIYDKED